MSKSVVVSASHRWRVTYRKTQIRPWRALRIHTDPMADKSDVGSYETQTAVALLARIAPWCDDDVAARVIALAEDL